MSNSILFFYHSRIDGVSHFFCKVTLLLWGDILVNNPLFNFFCRATPRNQAERLVFTSQSSLKCLLECLCVCLSVCLLVCFSAHVKYSSAYKIVVVTLGQMELELTTFKDGPRYSTIQNSGYINLKQTKILDVIVWRKKVARPGFLDPCYR